MSKTALLAAHSSYVLLKQTLLSQPMPSQGAACTSLLEDCPPNTVLLHWQDMTRDGVFATDVSFTAFHRYSPADSVWSSSSSWSGQRWGIGALPWGSTVGGVCFWTHMWHDVQKAAQSSLGICALTLTKYWTFPFPGAILAGGSEPITEPFQSVTFIQILITLDIFWYNTKRYHYFLGTTNTKMNLGFPHTEMLNIGSDTVFTTAVTDTHMLKLLSQHVHVQPANPLRWCWVYT